MEAPPTGAVEKSGPKEKHWCIQRIKKTTL